MFKNYFNTAFRNFGSNKVFFFINTSGPTIGIGALLAIYMIVGNKFVFDSYEKDKDHMYRVASGPVGAVCIG